MKLPRDVSADRLVRVLRLLGYEIAKQRGSHIRLRHPGPPGHSVTVPQHDPLKVGTLHGILAEVAYMRSLSIDDIVRML